MEDFPKTMVSLSATFGGEHGSFNPLEILCATPSAGLLPEALALGGGPGGSAGFPALAMATCGAAGLITGLGAAALAAEAFAIGPGLMNLELITMAGSG